MRRFAWPRPWKLGVATVGWILIFSGMWAMGSILGEPDPGAAALVALLTVSLFWWLLHALARQMMMAPFEVKGRVLDGAEVRVHGIEALDPADQAIQLPPDYDDPDDLEPERSFRFDLTLEPKPNDGPFSLYSPWELTLVPPGFRPKGAIDEDDEHALGYPIRQLEIFQDGAFRRHDDDKLAAAARWRFVAEIPEDVDTVRLFYYFHLVGPAMVLDSAR